VTNFVKKHIVIDLKRIVNFILNRKTFLFTIASFLIFYIFVSLKDVNCFDISYVLRYFMDSFTLRYFRESPGELNFIRIFSFLLNAIFISLLVLHIGTLILRFLKPILSKFYKRINQRFIVLEKRLSPDKWSLIFGIFFILIILYSFVIYRDFGIPIDEKVEYSSLLVTGKKVFTTLGLLENAPESLRKAQELDTYADKYYGVSAQIPLLLLEYFSENLDYTTPLFWEIRHMYVRVFFIIAGFCFYSLLKPFIKSNLVLLIGLVLFFFHPRISAHSFYNIKDSLFLSLFTISAYFMFKYINTSTLKNLVFFAITTAFAINARLTGAFIPIYFVFYTLFSNRSNFKWALKNLFIYSFLTALTLYIIWPVLWSNPCIEIFNAFKTFSNYSKWGGTVLFMGKVIKASELPITYVPVWILITSPFHHLVIYIVGFLFLFYCFFKRGSKNGVNNILFFSLFVLLSTYGSVIIFNSTLYDDWRHLYFIFPFLIIPGIIGLDFVHRSNKVLFLVILSVMLISFINTSFWMVRNHPYHYVYFNYLAGRNWDKRWDRDYWFLSSKQMLEELLDGCSSLNKQEKISVCANYHVSYNQYIIPPEKRGALLFVNSLKDCDYAIGDYRNILGDYKREDFPGFNEFVSVKVDGKKIMTLFKRKEL